MSRANDDRTDRGAPAAVAARAVGSPAERIVIDQPSGAAAWSAQLGLPLLVLGLVIALTLPGLLGRRQPGSAVSAPPAAPPAVGQCRAPLIQDRDVIRRTDLPLVSCTEAHSAEITAILQRPERELRAIRRTGPGQDLLDTCHTAITAYLGLTGPATDPASPEAPQFEVLLGMPSEYQLSSGQTWLTCEVAPPLFGLPVSYVESVRGLAAGPVPAHFSYCAGVVGGPPVSCLAPHLAQKISGYLPEGDSPDCLTIAKRLIGRADPTFDSTVSVTAWRDEHGTACWATSGIGERLPSTIIGWGEKALPAG